MRWLVQVKRIPLKTVVTVEIIGIATVAAFFLPGGDDLYRFYLPFAQGCLDCGFNPWHASWILFPITLIPLRLLWPVWVFLTLVGLWWVCDQMNVNPIPVLLAFPTMGLVWLGQVEVLIAIGLTLGLLSPSPFVRGAGLVLASIKPHVTGVAILLLLIHDRERWKTLIVPGGVALLTAMVWGADWPLRWFGQRDPLAPLPVWGTAALFPYGLVAFGAIFVVRNLREKVVATLLASALSFPWFGVYSYGVFLVFLAPWWVIPASYAWVLAYPMLGNSSVRFAWTLPLSLLVILIWPHLRPSWDRVRQQLTATTPSDEGRI